MITLARAADAALRKLVPTVNAGACDPSVYCGCRFVYHSCTGSQCWAHYRHVWTDCNGLCKVYRTECPKRPAGPCSAAACTA
jgi:hypothetical protein